jgi:PBSX family phage terminase large subunit
MQPPANNHPAYLQCPDCGAIELTYTPQDYQEGIHEVEYTESFNEDTGQWEIDTQIVGAFGGYGSGKSRSSLTEVLIRALENPKGTGFLTAPTLQQLKRTTLKTFFNEVCPPPLIERYNKSDGEIELINGFVFYTIPSDDEEKLRSINAGICHMEEASGIKRTIYDQILTRLRDPFVKNKLFMVCSNPDLGWIKEIFPDNDLRRNPKHPEHEDYNPFVTTFVWATHLNKYLPRNFIEINSKGKPLWWIKRFLQGSFEHSEGMVYPNFMNAIIDDIPDFDKIAKTWERGIALDHGLRNPTAVTYLAIDPKEGIAYLYKEYYKPNTLVPEHAQGIKPTINEIPAGLIRHMVIDPSAKNKSDPINGKSVQALYAEYDLFFQPANNEIEAGILRVNSYIERGKLKIFRSCVNTIKEGLNYKFPEITMDDTNKNLDEKPVKKDDHAMDSLRYNLMRLPENPDDLKNDAFAPPKRYNLKTDDEYEYEDEESKGGFLDYV